MRAEELINQTIPPLKTTDPVEKALSWMDEFRVSQLPVVKSRKFLGLISEQDILDFDNFDAVISDIDFNFADASVQQHKHFYDVMKIAVRDNVHVVAVLDESEEFLGVITVNDAIAALSQMFAMQGPGGIIVLSMPERDYSLSHVSRLIEEEGAKIISSYVTPNEHDPHRIKLTLKINRNDLQRIIATLERFNYSIIAEFDEVATAPGNQDRLDLLFRYLNI